ncbi:MAG TPA: hypothetical protein VGC87_10535 [Pyrinomonadaceae bacterium]|jgi:hypothetical protein
MKNFNYLLRRSRRLLSLTVVGLLLVAAPASLVLSAPPPAQPLAPAEDGEEYIKTYAGDCATFQLFYAPGDHVCAEAGSFFSLNLRPRRFQWVAPDGQVVDLKDISADPQFDVITIPDSGPFAQAGKWTIRTVGRTASVKARGSFIVRNPLSVQIDLSIDFRLPDLVLPLDHIDIVIHAASLGPDDGLDIEFTSEVPTNMTFVGMKQINGPEFECLTPKQGDTGTITCKGKSLALDEVADFQVQYQVNAEAREGETCSAVSHITSPARDFNEWDNTSEARTTVASQER